MEQSDYFDKFLQGYCVAMLWANTDQVGPDGEPTGESVNPDDWQAPIDLWALDAFDERSQESIREDCQGFVNDFWDDLKGLDPAQCGHDFALTRNGHGAGFWDRGLGELGDRLTAASKPYGSSSAYFSDGDDIVYLDS